MELAMQDSLKAQIEDPPPFLPSLLGRPNAPALAVYFPDDVLNSANRFVRTFKLNADQAEALRSTAGWFPDSCEKV